MGNINKIEELLMELPDYINNKLEDKIIKENIEYEISHNPDFKSEYEEMKRSFEFIHSPNYEIRLKIISTIYYPGFIEN